MSDKIGRDAARYQWLMPVVTGEDDVETLRKSLALAGAIVRGLTGDEAVDAAMKEVP